MHEPAGRVEASADTRAPGKAGVVPGRGRMRHKPARMHGARMQGRVTPQTVLTPQTILTPHNVVAAADLLPMHGIVAQCLVVAIASQALAAGW